MVEVEFAGRARVCKESEFFDTAGSGMERPRLSMDRACLMGYRFLVWAGGPVGSRRPAQAHEYGHQRSRQR